MVDKLVRKACVLECRMAHAPQLSDDLVTDVSLQFLPLALINIATRGPTAGRCLVIPTRVPFVHR